MRGFALFSLLLLFAPPLATSGLRLRLPVEEAKPAAPSTHFGEIELTELLRNPSIRNELVGREISVVGELTLFEKPDPVTGKIGAVGFSKTRSEIMYKIWCRLKEPLTKEQFDQLSNASYVTLQGRCSVHSRTRAVGSDLWYQFTVSLAEGRVTPHGSAEEGP